MGGGEGGGGGHHYVFGWQFVCQSSKQMANNYPDPEQMSKFDLRLRKAQVLNSIKLQKRKTVYSL